MNKQKVLSVLLAIILLSINSIYSFASEVVENTETTTNENSNNVVISNDIQELNNQRNEIQENLQEVTSQLEYVQSEMSDILIEIQELDDKIRQYEQENNEFETKLQTLETSVKETTEKLDVVTQDYNKKKEQLTNRLVAMYEAGETSYLDVLLSASSLSDFLSAYYAMIEIAEYDNALIDKVEEEKNIIDEAKTKLESETAQIKTLKAKAEQSQILLTNTKALQQGKVETLTQEEQELNEKIKEYKNDKAQIEAKIQEINGYQGEIDIQYTGGTMIWPVAASGTVITSYYGGRIHPIDGISDFHLGLDIAGTGYGGPAVAAEDGVVTYSGWLGSYGNCVMIYHGDGISTLYGHGLSTLVERGQEVKQGEVIMQIGSTGNSTGPHLHFEVRINGRTTNPLNFVNIP